MTATALSPHVKDRYPRLEVIDGGGTDERCSADWELDYQSARSRHPAFRQRELQKIVVSQSQNEATFGRDSSTGVLTQALKVCAYLLLVCVLFAVGLSVGSWFGDGEYEGDTTRHSVQQGESVWSIAQGMDSDRPLHQVVEDIRTLNGIEAGTLLAGEVLTLPAR